MTTETAEHVRRAEEPESPALRIVEPPASPDAWPSEVDTFLRDLAGPSWILVPGRDRARARIVSTLLHGNEPSGVRAIHAFLCSGEMPAVDTVFFIASVDAALEPPGFAHRMLYGRRDLNRCFFPPFQGREGALAREVLGRIRDLAPEALVDLHNTTGHTPAYGVGPKSDPARLALTRFFAARYVESDLRLGALIEAVADETTSLVVECGMTGDAEPDRIAREGLGRFLEAETLFPTDPAEKPEDAITVVASPVRVCLQPGLTLRYGEACEPGADLTLDAALDRHNFEPIAPGASIGWVPAEGAWPFVATRADGAEVSRDLFELRGGRVEARTDFVPIMMTTDPEIAVQDCIFYAAVPKKL
ncbi:MAG: succinylglutamate desuccinylase/aspartoacylase family protein [Deltaproteobacteria bacterium]|nr:succinylglutamate desuccinylase/aspartoacylase family protein [Deltaproteobacteria bacterium]